MEPTEDDEDLVLARASANLLADLEQDLPKLLWKRSRPHEIKNHRRVHTHVKRRDRGHIINLIEPFQGEPQLLDAKLKSILPPLVDAYLSFLGNHIQPSSGCIDLETAVCGIIYTLCKVRGYKIVVGFLSNEPRYLESILKALERTLLLTDDDKLEWQVPYVLLLWLSHLLLTPFDLNSISAEPGPHLTTKGLDDTLTGLPPLTGRITRVGLAFLTSPTKAQDAAAALLVRLSVRPDVQKLQLADILVKTRLPRLQANTSETRDIYETLGSLRLIANVASSAELSHLVPSIYNTCASAFDEGDSAALSSNAVAKKLVVKIFRNVAILSLHSMAADGALLTFLQSTDVLESVIDHLLRSLGDKDTPVRYAAAKAIGLIVQELEPSMGYEIIQAILDTFKEDMPRSARSLDFSTVNPLKWHGLTLALSHTLFKRSASPDQLPDILDALISALQFQQRTATGTTLGTNVRDAANFGIWSLARRYITKELLPVKITILNLSHQLDSGTSIIQALAIQLMLAACLDPAGNIRRGSSAALQELVGRHPDQVYEGISLVQIVDYQAVSLRNRAMINVANKAASLRQDYWRGLLDGLFGWRGIGAADVPSREAAATSIARLATLYSDSENQVVLQRVSSDLRSSPPSNVESLHGLALATALLLENVIRSTSDQSELLQTIIPPLLDTIQFLHKSLKSFTPRTLRSELPSSVARVNTAVCGGCLAAGRGSISWISTADVSLEGIDATTDLLFTGREDWILQIIPGLAASVFNLKHALDMPLACIDVQTLSRRVTLDSTKSTLHSAGGAIALGTLAPMYNSAGLTGDQAVSAVACVCSLLSVANVDWRIVGAKALQLVVAGVDATKTVDSTIAESICAAVHQGLNDYTVDERGDIGSLVRSQSITCASTILSTKAFQGYRDSLRILEGDIYRLSLEKLDKVRLQAAQCRKDFLDLDHLVYDIASVSSIEYFHIALAPLASDAPVWVQKSLLDGVISCAGSSAEALLQASRTALTSYLESMELNHLQEFMTQYSMTIKELLSGTLSCQPALELLAFLLDMQIPQRLAHAKTFKWLNLLSTAQKSHHKSNDIPKILAAVHVYTGLTDIPSIRHETLKKLLNMLKTNPYPRIRSSVAEVLWMATGDDALRSCDWGRPPAQNALVWKQIDPAKLAS